MSSKPRRALRLSRETVRDLDREDLRDAAGGVQSIIPTCRCTGYYPSLNAPCTPIIIVQGTLNTAC